MNRILIVEDNHDVLWVVKIVLKRYGFKVMAIPRGEDVIDKSRTFRPQLILLDVVLSGISGIDVCNELKSNDKTKDIPMKQTRKFVESLGFPSTDSYDLPTSAKRFPDGASNANRADFDRRTGKKGWAEIE